MKKEIFNQVQEAQRVPYRINPRRNTPRHILIKLTKTNCKERMLKAAKEKQQVTYRGNLICLTADLSAETLQTRREWLLLLLLSRFSPTLCDSIDGSPPGFPIPGILQARTLDTSKNLYAY